jgi:hypothetical protein
MVSFYDARQMAETRKKISTSDNGTTTAVTSATTYVHRVQILLGAPDRDGDVETRGANCGGINQHTAVGVGVFY